MIDQIEQEIDAHLAVISELKSSAAKIQEVADALIDALKGGHRIYIFGNGGSAADAQHIAAELVGRFKRSNKAPQPAIALTVDSSNLTAIGNDFGFDQVFARQVDALVEAGDVVWALSVSGKSPNVIAAVKAARHKGARIIAFTGSAGTTLTELSDVTLTAAHADSDRVQEAHQLAYHVVCGLVEEALG